jgi:hypothetical protein
MTSQSLFVDQSGSPYVPDATLINHGLLVFRPQYRQSNVQITSGLLNYGTMVVEGGELMLQDACQGDGTVDVREGAVLTFQQVSSSCSSYDCAFHKHFTVNSSLIGKGTIRVEASAGLDVSSAYIAPSLLWEIKSGGLTLHAVHPVTFDEPVAVSSGTLTVEGNTVAFRNLIVSGGTVNLRSPSQVEELHQSGGILMLSDTASIAGGRWLGGTWQGLRSTVLHLQDLTICGSSSHFFRDLQLNVSGSIKWQGSGHIYGYGNTQVRQTQIASPPLFLSHTHKNTHHTTKATTVTTQSASNIWTLNRDGRLRWTQVTLLASASLEVQSSFLTFYNGDHRTFRPEPVARTLPLATCLLHAVLVACGALRLPFMLASCPAPPLRIPNPLPAR